jgi:hypothetical protein
MQKHHKGQKMTAPIFLDRKRRAKGLRETLNTAIENAIDNENLERLEEYMSVYLNCSIEEKSLFRFYNYALKAHCKKSCIYLLNILQIQYNL